MAFVVCASHGLPARSSARLCDVRGVRTPRRPRCSLETPPESMSAPFPFGDMFSPQHVVFVRAVGLSVTQRPELLGSLLWAVGLYFGLSQRERWGSALKSAMFENLPFSDDLADSVATALHTLPFLLAGIAIDAGIQVASGGESVWAIASGLTLAMYGGVYEAGRASFRAKKVDETEARAFDAFQDFAARRLQRSGRCHLYDVKSAMNEDSKGQFILRRLSDGQIRRFIRAYAPGALRSPNGFYRKLSVRARGDDGQKF